MKALQPSAICLLLSAGACDQSTPDPAFPDTIELRAAEAVVLDEVATGDVSALALDGDPGESPVVWAIVDRPRGPGTEACVLGLGSDALFAPVVPGTYVLRALVLDPESREALFEVDTEVFVEGDAAPYTCAADIIVEDEVSGIDPTPFHDEVSGIDPTPFREGEVSGIDPTPFLGSVLLEDGTSLSPGCLCYEG